MTDAVFHAARASKADDGDVSSFRLDLDRSSGVVTLIRTGSVSSRLIFDTSKETEGTVGTPFGTFDVRIRTDYINMPSLMDNCFTISYTLFTGEQGEGNLFKIELL